MNKDKLAAITYIMADMGVTLKELFDYQSEIGKSDYDGLTQEDPDEEAWLDENVRGKEEELRTKALQRELHNAAMEQNGLEYTGDDLHGEPIYKKKIEVTDGSSTEKEG